MIPMTDDVIVLNRCGKRRDSDRARLSISNSIQRRHDTRASRAEKRFVGGKNKQTATIPFSGPESTSCTRVRLSNYTPRSYDGVGV